MNVIKEGEGPFFAMVLMLRNPASLALHPDEPAEALQFDGAETTFATWTPWPALPEILVCAASREFAGLSWAVHPTEGDRVRSIASALDGLVVRYNTPRMLAWRKPYGADQQDYFEVVWAQDEPDTLEEAQLAEAGWYYSDRVPPTPFDPEFWCGLGVPEHVLSKLGACGLEVAALSFILERWNLVFPTRFRCPVRIERTPEVGAT